MTPGPPSSQIQHYDLATAAHDYAPWEGEPRRSIVLCSHPRSGSTLLSEALYFAGALGCPVEYFHIGCRPGFAARWGADALDDYVAAAWRHRTDPDGTFATKLMWRDVEELGAERGVPGVRLHGASPAETSPETYRLLAEMLRGMLPAAEWVHLERRDRLRQAVSATIALTTGQWRDIPGEAVAARAGPEFDAAAIDRLIAYSDYCHGHWRNLFTVLACAPVEVGYEELTEDYSGTVARVLAALGSDAPAPEPRMRRQADGRSEALLLRYLRKRG